mmetsp:Transcript_72194/g.205176  ORF Transcript_72194/g.205176 Transcript_72194/m.205176 type:complete len:227 (+) Transcript_72194:369-1049(+)
MCSHVRPPEPAQAALCQVLRMWGVYRAARRRDSTMARRLGGTVVWRYSGAAAWGSSARQPALVRTRGRSPFDRYRYGYGYRVAERWCLVGRPTATRLRRPLARGAKVGRVVAVVGGIKNLDAMREASNDWFPTPSFISSDRVGEAWPPSSAVVEPRRHVGEACIRRRQGSWLQRRRGKPPVTRPLPCRQGLGGILSGKSDLATPGKPPVASPLPCRQGRGAIISGE